MAIVGVKPSAGECFDSCVILPCSFTLLPGAGAAGCGAAGGVPAKRFLLLNDGESGRSLAITLFETEDDYRQGDETLGAMNPPGDGMGRRVSVEKYEVAVQLET
jgi:hypothetical protein